MTPRTCALCGERDAATLTDLDGRAVPACTRCLAPVPDPATPYEPADLVERVRDRPKDKAAPFAASPMRDAVLQAVRSLGAATTTDIREALGYHTRAEQNHVTVVLSRLVRAGALRAEELVPGQPSCGRVYSATGRPPAPISAPASRKLRHAIEAVSAAQGEFTWADIGVTPAALGILRKRGLVTLVQRPRDVSQGGRRVKVPAVWRRVASEATRAA